MNKFLLVLLFCVNAVFAQDAYHIKSFQFEGSKESVYPIFRLGETIRFSFDDLLGTEVDYNYRITHCTRDWKPSTLKRTEYIYGNELVRLRNLSNSFTTLQMYTHYQESFPNQYQKILLSGNYILELLNSDEEVLLTRKFVVYEDQVTVALEAKRSRDLSTSSQKQNLYVTIDLGTGLYQNPNQYLQLVLMQNGQFFNTISNVKPQFIIGNQLKYQYDKETSFFGGNEFLYFDNSDIRITNNTIATITAGDLYESHLFTDRSKADVGYTFFEDLNGAFYPNIRYRSENVRHVEADYAWVYFSLDTAPRKEAIYVAGMFNGYQFNEDNKMTFNRNNNRYEAALLLKQGFTSYQYYVSKDGGIDFKDNISGNYFETENQYHALVYYKGPTDRYDRIIGMGSVRTNNITN